MMTGMLQGRVALITGGASGIGAAIAERFVREGAAVAIADRDEDRAQALASKLADQGSAIACRVDVSDPEDVEAMTARVEGSLGSPDILVTSAGIGMQKAFLDTTIEEWNRIMSVNLAGAFLCGQAVARRMVARGYGRIVNISSGAGLRGVSGRSAYGASKAGLILLTQVMAAELGSRGITVNAIAPGPIETPLTMQMHTAETRAAYINKTPLQRYGRLDEVASAAVFLASEQSSYITADTLQVDGGMAATGPLFKI